MARGKYALLPDLFVEGSELVFPNKTVMWLQVLNPFEIDEARKDAAAARSRYTLAMREIGSAEYDGVTGAFYGRPVDENINDMIKIQGNKFFLDGQSGVMNDPEWAERLEIARRNDEVPPTDEAEIALHNKINADFVAEVTQRIDAERDFTRRMYEAMPEEELLEEYRKLWLENRATEIGLKAFRVAEVFYGARVCEAEPTQDGYFNERSHSKCEQHKERVYETKEEVRELPEGQWNLIRGGFEQLAMSERDARFSDRQESSSASSPLPSAEVESTPSTPETTSSGAPGT